MALTPDSRRVYYGDSSRAIWFYDRTDKRHLRLTAGGNSDLALAPTGDAIAFVRIDPATASQHVWMLPLDPRTGVASGSERRLSRLQGDVPVFSPDGRSVAFASDDSVGVGQGIVVVSRDGGAARTLVPVQRSGIGSIRWSPDGRWIYYGLNAPVACDPEWSCLEVKAEFKPGYGSIRRVGANGGESRVVIPKAGNGWPGLSTDGSLIAFADTTATPRLIVADTSGRQLGAFPAPPRRTIEGWLDASTLLLSDRGDSRRLRALSVADGSDRVVVDTLESLAEISPSPDGKLVSAVRCIGQVCDLRIVTSTGNSVNVVKLPERFTGGNVWSPDGRMIALVGGPPATAGNVYTVDVTAGTTTRLMAFRASTASLSWTADSRSVLVSTTVGTGASRHSTIQRATLDAKVTNLRDFVVGPTPSVASAVDAGHALVMRGGTITLATLEGDSTEQVVLPPSNERYAGFMIPSPDSQWFAFRRARGEDDGQRGIIDLVRRDGRDHTAIELPFVIFPGASGLRFLGNSEQLVVLAGPSKEEPVPAAYLVNTKTRAIRKLVRFPQLFVGELNASPDGGTVYYITNEFTGPRVFTMDLEPLRSARRP
jgi:Tol biopolymer transport system component